mgnify:CR=1 FL=1
MDGAPGLSYAGNADASFLLGAGRARPTNNLFQCAGSSVSDPTPAAKRRKNAAHGASRGSAEVNEQAPEGRKKTQPSREERL